MVALPIVGGRNKLGLRSSRCWAATGVAGDTDDERLAATVDCTTDTYEPVTVAMERERFGSWAGVRRPVIAIGVRGGVVCSKNYLYADEGLQPVPYGSARYIVGGRPKLGCRASRVVSRYLNSPCLRPPQKILS